MRIWKAALLSVVLSLAATIASSETLYKWIDGQGVQRFSNQPPPSDVEAYETFESAPEPSSDSGQREEFKHMLQKVEQENRQNEAQARQEASQRANEKKRKAEAERRFRIQAERQDLERQIEAIEKRALGPNFTQGMRQAQIEQIKLKIEALEESGKTGTVPKNSQGAEAGRSTY
ncbi:MAG: DUF4124 domain-containing protein [Desulfobacteraceae bacterium]|nr:MAG: DUF4124 domain-containing protein [Desulfobacteraceae bacterium]